MQIPTAGILVNPGRREVDPDHVGKLAESIKELGLLNPITIDKSNTLIAGLHRLERLLCYGEDCVGKEKQRYELGGLICSYSPNSFVAVSH